MKLSKSLQWFDLATHSKKEQRVWNTVLYVYRRERRGERASPPPRFARGRGDHRSGGFDRGGRSRGRGRGGSVPSGVGKGPQLTKQNSSDLATEEWETASENSDFLDRRDSKNDLKDNHDKRDRDPKKSFSSQRPQNDRQNRRVSSDQRGGNNNKNYDHSKNFHKERIAHSSQTKNGYSAPSKNGLGGGKRPPHNSGNKKESSGNQVFRVEGVVPADQVAIDNAINNTYSDK